MSFQNYGHQLHHERVAASQTLWHQFERLLLAYADLAQTDTEVRLLLVKIAQNLGIDPLALAINARDLPQCAAVLCVDLCRELWAQQGGNANLAQIESRLDAIFTASGQSLPPVNPESIITALGKVGPAFRLEVLPNQSTVVRSTATELSSEQGSILSACDALGYVTVEMLRANFGWDSRQCQQWLNDMLSAGLLWIDEQSSPISYWTPSVI